MALAIKFKSNDDHLVEKIRNAAQAENYAGTEGFKEWAKVTYNANLRFGKYLDWTSIVFENDTDMAKFKNDLNVVDGQYTKIQMLAKQAGFTKESMILDSKLQKFAELIVKECLNNMENDDGDLSFAIWKTKKDFGVEK